MSSLLRSLIEKVEEIFKSESSKRQVKRENLFRIIGPKIRNWTTYGDIVDIVKQKAPGMYEWGKGHSRYVSLELREDLNLLFLRTRHFRLNNCFCYTAYKTKN